MGRAAKKATQKPVREKVLNVMQGLNKQFVERKGLIYGMMTALLSGEHILLLGPPGTAKSDIASTLCNHIPGAKYFYWLLTRFSTPEELFGPPSLKGLEQDKYERKTEGKLPTAHVAFCDEINGTIVYDRSPSWSNS